MPAGSPAVSATSGRSAFVVAVLDEGVPVRLAKALAGVGCRAPRFPDEWKGLRNGQLAERLRASGIRCLITCDKNFRHQQNVARQGFVLVVLPRQRLGDLLPLLSNIAAAVEEAEVGQVVLVADLAPVRG